MTRKSSLSLEALEKELAPDSLKFVRDCAECKRNRKRIKTLEEKIRLLEKERAS